MSGRVTSTSVEDLFNAEFKLRVAAREYSSHEHGQCSIELRNKSRQDLRAAARAYSAIAARLEAAP